MHGSRPVRRALSGVVAATAVIVTTLGVSPEPASAADAIETAFAQPGPSAVTWDDGPGGCDAGGTPTTDYTYVHPTNLGAGGTDHPIIAWGNGSGATTCAYRELLEHWASWGFVVVAANTAQSGRGTEILVGAAVTVNLNTDNSPSNIFYQNLDTSSIAAAGHSQGAVGAINAASGGGGMFESVLAMSMPNRDALESYNGGVCQFLFGSNCIPVPIPARTVTNQLGAPIFFVRGTGLHNPSPCNWDDWMSDNTDDSVQGWYPTNASVPFAAATVRVDPPSNPAQDCNIITVLFPYPHLNLTNATGYMTAWLGYTLNDNLLARAAFVGSPPEIETNIPTNGGRWSQITLENLP